MSEFKLIFEDLGLSEYKKTWDYQEEVHNELIASHAIDKLSPHRLIFVEHPHVYTLGQSGTQNNLLINDDFLKKINASYYRTNRGGDITYHGPGQIVGYPIFNLFSLGMGVRDYIFKLEDSIIECLKDFGIESTRLEGATGVWLDVGKPGFTRKICAIGVRVGHGVTMHGFAFNVNTNLSYFNHINPCGFVDKGVTSLEKELGCIQDFTQVKIKLLQKMREIFQFEII